MGKAVEKTEGKAKTLMEYLKARTGQIENAMAAMAQRHLGSEQMLRLFLLAVRRTPRILECRPDSVVMALCKAASVQLDPSGVNGEGHLVLYWNGRRRCYELEFIPGYRGVVLNLRRSGAVVDVEASAVLDTDEFEHEKGLSPRLRHVQDEKAFYDPEEAWDHIRCAYAVATLPDGTKKFHIVPRGYLERIRAQATRNDESRSGPWFAWPEAQCAKTAVKQLAKLLVFDRDSLAARTLELDNAAESGGEAALDVDVIKVAEDVEGGSRTEDVLEAAKQRLRGRRTSKPAAQDKDEKAEAAKPVSGHPSAEDRKEGDKTGTPSESPQAQSKTPPPPIEVRLLKSSEQLVRGKWVAVATVATEEGDFYIERNQLDESLRCNACTGATDCPHCRKTQELLTADVPEHEIPF